MPELTLNLPLNIYSKLESLSKNYFRTLEEQVLYCLDQGLKMQRHMSDSDTALLKVLAELYEKKNMKKVSD